MLCPSWLDDCLKKGGKDNSARTHNWRCEDVEEGDGMVSPPSHFRFRHAHLKSFADRAGLIGTRSRAWHLCDDNSNFR